MSDLFLNFNSNGGKFRQIFFQCKLNALKQKNKTENKFKFFFLSIFNKKDFQ